MPLDEINRTCNERGLKAQDILPFAKDSDGETFLCLKIGDRDENTVVVVDASDNSVQEDLGMSYAIYLEQIRQKLLTGKLVYEEGMGLITVA